MIDVKTLSDTDLIQLEVAIKQERELRRVPLAMEALNSRFLAAEGTEPGQEWREPVGMTNAYPKDWEVTWNGKRWKSTIPFNVWEPGVSSWDEVVPEGAPPPDWVQPDSTNPYKIGARVTFAGAVYESLIDGNVWSPTDYPQGWKLITE